MCSDERSVTRKKKKKVIIIIKKKKEKKNLKKRGGGGCLCVCVSAVWPHKWLGGLVRLRDWWAGEAQGLVGW